MQPITLTADGAHLIASFPYDLEATEEIRALPDGREFDKKRGVWRLDATPDNLMALRQLRPTVTESARRLIGVIEQREEVVRQLQWLRVHPQECPDLFPFKTKPWDHQRVAFEYGRRLACVALLMEQGTGKTKVAIDVMRYRFFKDAVRRVLVVCPVAVLWTWQEEIAVHSKIPAHRVNVLYGPKKKRLKLLANDNVLVDIVNYEALLSIGDQLLARSYQMVVADESTKIKNPKAKRTKALWRISDLARFRMALTGTPVTNSPLDLFAQWRFLDLGRTFGTMYFTFRQRWFRPINIGQKNVQKWVPRRGTPKALGQRIGRTAVQYRKEECMDLPPKVFKRVPVEMSAEQWRVYRELVDQMITEIEGREFRAEWAMTRVLKLAQVASGFLMKDEEVGLKPDGSPEIRRVVVHFKKNPKADAVEELVEQSVVSGKVLVWAHFRESVELLARRLSDYQPALIYGGTKDIRGELRRFHDSDACRALIANPASAGMGLTLTEAPTAIYFERGYSAEGRWQSIDRNHRGGSEIHDRILYLDAYCRGTVELDILNALEAHANIRDRVMSPERFVELVQGETHDR